MLELEQNVAERKGKEWISVNANHERRKEHGVTISYGTFDEEQNNEGAKYFR